MNAADTGPEAAGDTRRRAGRLLRWYPRAWRERYGAELAELLISDLAESPRSLSRTLDIIRCGLTARLADAGLAGVPTPSPAEDGTGAAASLASRGACLAVFACLGAAL